MALAPGDPGLLASAWPQSGVSTAPIVSGGNGSFITFLAGDSSAVLNSGVNFDGNSALVLEVAPGTSGLLGSYVQVTGFDPTFRGAVIAELQVEVGTTGGTGALSECVLVQGDGFRFIALVSAVTEVAD